MSKKNGAIVFMYTVDDKSSEVRTSGLDDAPDEVKKMILRKLLDEYGVL